MNRTYQVGDATVTRVPEIGLDGVDAAALYPDLDAAALAEHGPSLTAGSYDLKTGGLKQSIHTWLVRMPGRVILVDTATGNGKDLPSAPVLDQLNEPYLERLAAAGVAPEKVDTVLLTHIHADHVGWNTRRQSGRWVPTFTRARHIFSRIEQRYNASLSGGEAAPDLPAAALGPPVRTPTPGVYADSMVPIIEAGLGQPIDIDGSEVLDGISFHPTPGHSIDHASIRLRSRGEEAWFLGDLMHHPLQVYRPDLRSCYCEFPDPARRSRLRMLEQTAGSGALLFTTHFAETAAGRVSRGVGGFRWHFE